jgi:hypothetical protein
MMFFPRKNTVMLAAVSVAILACWPADGSPQALSRGTASCPTAPSTVPSFPPPKIPPVGNPTAEPSLAAAWPPLAGLPPRCPAVPLVGTHATYNIGPGKRFTDLTSFPWLNLVAGDVVNIYYSPTPYATKFALRASGKSGKPIIINGVADANGKLPEITGANAVTATDAIAQGFFTSSGGSAIEPFGVIVLYRGLNDAYGYKPANVTIQNLRITGAAPGNQYTDHTGTLQTYPQFTAGIYAVAAQYLTIQNDELFGNGLGIFVNDQNDLAGTSFFVTLRGNYIHDNGVAGSFSEHNVYVQGVRSLYEGNVIGQLIPNAQGASLKDRSSGPVVRYNFIVSAARAIDLVDSEGGSPETLSDPLYDYGWVYGNVIVDDFDNPGASSGDIIHWGGDSTVYSEYHNGPLYFYDNTLFIRATQAQAYSLSAFDLPTNRQSIVLANNIIAHTGTSILYPCTDSLSNGTKGTLQFVDTNWIAPNQSHHDCKLDKSAGTFLPGKPVLTSTYGLPAGSPASGPGVPYPPLTQALPPPASVPDLQVTQEFTTLPSAKTVQPSYTPRTTVTDLGAIAYP